MSQAELIRGIVRDWLEKEISSISEETCCAGWMQGIEYSVWREIQRLPADGSIYGERIDADRLHRMKEAAEWLGQWIWWDEENDDPCPISLDRWERIFDARTSQQPSGDSTQ